MYPWPETLLLAFIYCKTILLPDCCKKILLKAVCIAKIYSCKLLSIAKYTLESLLPFIDKPPTGSQLLQYNTHGCCNLCKIIIFSAFYHCKIILFLGCIHCKIITLLSYNHCKIILMPACINYKIILLLAFNHCKKYSSGLLSQEFNSIASL